MTGPLPRVWSTMWTVCVADLARELRRPIASAAVLVFGVSSLVVLRLALAGDSRPMPSVLAGALWILLVFAAIVGTGRAWSAEREDGAFDALLVAPAARSAIHAGKVLAVAFTTLALDAILVTLYLALFGAPDDGGVARIVEAVVLAAVGFAAVGVLVSALGMRARGRDLLGPTMFLPLAIPLVLAAVSLTIAAFDGSDAGGNLHKLELFLLAYDATFLVAGIAAFPELAVD